MIRTLEIIGPLLSRYWALYIVGVVSSLLLSSVEVGMTSTIGSSSSPNVSPPLLVPSTSFVDEVLLLFPRVVPKAIDSITAHRRNRDSAITLGFLLLCFVSYGLLLLSSAVTPCSTGIEFSTSPPPPLVISFSSFIISVLISSVYYEHALYSRNCVSIKRAKSEFDFLVHS